MRAYPRLTEGQRNQLYAGSVLETTYLISSIKSPEPESILKLNRNHWQIEIMHTDKDVTLGEDRYTNQGNRMSFIPELSGTENPHPKPPNVVLA